jgi:hypothetical protein
MARWRNHLMSAGQFAKAGLGILFIAIGALVITGLDKIDRDSAGCGFAPMVDRIVDAVLDRRA